MVRPMPELLIALNAGSSSLKIAAFDARSLECTFKTTVAIATPEQAADQALRRVVDGSAAGGTSQTVVDGSAAGGTSQTIAVGHRIVHGGDRFTSATLLSDDVLTALDELVPLDPDHLPAAIAVIRAMQTRLPHVPQVACFDTAFHHDMPAVAKRLAIPRRFGMHRYGFHGLSYTYLMSRLPQREARGRVVLAHLGAGASLAAVMNGGVVDTTMGFTPTAGIPMATRTGDLDPGVMLQWMRTTRMDVAALDHLVNHESGLLGVSETTGDMRELLAHEATDERAREAIELFCYEAKKAIGALAAAMGGISTLVFSGGIGEHAAPVRARIATGPSISAFTWTTRGMPARPASSPPTRARAPYTSFRPTKRS
jgi:acetate kinase